MFSMVARLLCYLAIFFSMAFPGDFTAFKACLLMLAVLLSFFDSAKLLPDNFTGCFFATIFLWYLVTGFGFIVSLWNGFEIDSYLITTLWVTPIISLLIANQLIVRSSWSELYFFIFLATSFICLVNVAYYFQINSLLPFDLPDLTIFGAARETDSILEYRVNNQVSLIFLSPLLILFAIIGNSQKLIQSFYIRFIAVLVVLVALFSGRRALQFNVIVSILIGIACLCLNKKRSNLFNYVFLALMIVALLSICYFLSFSDQGALIFNTFVSAFDSADESFDIKMTQKNLLVEGWMDSPIFGHGASSYIRDYVRNDDLPWSYEMVYHAFLFQNGLIGMIVPIVFTLSIIKVFTRYLLSLNVNKAVFGLGLVFFIAAGASNPMIYFFWFWVFAFVFISGKMVNE